MLSTLFGVCREVASKAEGAAANAGLGRNPTMQEKTTTRYNKDQQALS